MAQQPTPRKLRIVSRTPGVPPVEVPILNDRIQVQAVTDARYELLDEHGKLYTTLHAQRVGNDLVLSGADDDTAPVTTPAIVINGYFAACTPAPDICDVGGLLGTRYQPVGDSAPMDLLQPAQSGLYRNNAEDDSQMPLLLIPPLLMAA